MHDLAICVRCEKPVRLPQSANAIWVRCPHCGDDYPSDQLAPCEPPELEVVPPPSLVSPVPVQQTAQKSADLHQPTLEQHAHGSTALTVAPAATFAINEEEVHVRSPSALHSKRRQKAQPNREPQLGIIKVALGGVAGLLLGQLILWWLPAPYRSDPIELAGKLPKPIAFLAPAAMRGIPVEPTSDEKRLAVHKVIAEDAVLTADDPQPIPVEPTGAESPSALMLGTADEPLFKMSELRESLQSSKNANDSIIAQQSTRATPIELSGEDASRWYNQLSELSYRVTFADTKEPETKIVEAEIRELLGTIGTDPSMPKVIGNSAAGAIEDSALHRKGIIVAGKVTTIESIGYLFRTELALLGDSGKTIDVVSHIDPRKKNAYGVNDEVLIMGVYVTDPSLYLIGYVGSADSIVLGGLPHKM